MENRQARSAEWQTPFGFILALLTPVRDMAGDEFALLLPETGWKAAQEATRRICERVATDVEQPSVSTSVGFAVYPHDGETIEALFGAADRCLYRMKGRTAELLPIAK